MPPETRKFLYDIQLACQAMEQFTAGKSLDDYQADLLLRSGVERQLTIIGEALNQALRVDPTLAGKITCARQIIGFRNVVVHGYSTIEDETVWGILQNDLPTLHDEVRAMFSEEAGRNNNRTV